MLSLTDLLDIHDLIHLAALFIGVAVLKNDIKWINKNIDTHTAADSQQFKSLHDDIRDLRDRD